MVQRLTYRWGVPCSLAVSAGCAGVLIDIVDALASLYEFDTRQAAPLSTHATTLSHTALAGVPVGGVTAMPQSPIGLGW
jgi:hypothetical protein